MTLSSESFQINETKVYLAFFKVLSYRASFEVFKNRVFFLTIHAL